MWVRSKTSKKKLYRKLFSFKPTKFHIFDKKLILKPNKPKRTSVVSFIYRSKVFGKLTIQKSLEHSKYSIEKKKFILCPGILAKGYLISNYFIMEKKSQGA